MIFSPYASYIAVIKEAGFSAEDFLVADSETDVIQKIDWLRDVTHVEQVQELIHRQQEVAGKVSLDRILAKYERALED